MVNASRKSSWLSLWAEGNELVDAKLAICMAWHPPGCDCRGSVSDLLAILSERGPRLPGGSWG